MSGGLVELRIPTGWTVADNAVDAVWESNAIRGEIAKGSGVWTFTLTDGFGVGAADKLMIYLANVGVPNRHGNHTFTTRAKNSATGGLTRLTKQPQVLVGNTVADSDTVTVEITPGSGVPR